MQQMKSGLSKGLEMAGKAADMAADAAAAVQKGAEAAAAMADRAVDRLETVAGDRPATPEWGRKRGLRVLEYGELFEEKEHAVLSRMPQCVRAAAAAAAASVFFPRLSPPLPTGTDE